MTMSLSHQNDMVWIDGNLFVAKREYHFPLTRVSVGIVIEQSINTDKTNKCKLTRRTNCSWLLISLRIWKLKGSYLKIKIHKKGEQIREITVSCLPCTVSNDAKRNFKSLTLTIQVHCLQISCQLRIGRFSSYNLSSGSNNIGRWRLLVFVCRCTGIAGVVVGTVVAVYDIPNYWYWFFDHSFI